MLKRKSNKVAPAPPENASAAFGVTKDYRDRYGEEAFKALSSVAFQEADADQSGTMELGELKVTLEKIRISLSDEEVLRILKRYDDDGSGTISENEWHALLGDLLDGTLSLQAEDAQTGDDAAKPDDTPKADGGSDDVGTLRAEVAALRAENDTLRARVVELEGGKPAEPAKRKITRAAEGKKAPRLATKAATSAINIADTAKWKFTEARYSGAMRFVSIGAKSNEQKPIAEGIAKFKADPETYAAIWWQANMVDWPADQQRYTLLARKGTKGFTASDVSDAGRFGLVTAQYQRLSPDVDLSDAADAYTGEGGVIASYEGYALEEAVCPGRGHGVGDVPTLKILGDVDPSDIAQGGVGDCWLLCGISSLAEFDGAIKRLFRRTSNIESLPADTPNSYTITLWDLPTWSEVDIVVDERLAKRADGTGLLGAEISKDGELWVCYLEKALAIHCGGWDKINGGQCTHAWSMLTGCKDTYTIRRNASGNWGCYGKFNPNDNSWETLANSPHDGFTALWPSAWPATGGGGEMGREMTADELFERLCAWDDKNYIMGAGTKAGSDSESTDGIVDGHAYSVLECHNDVAGTDVDLVKVRNPWGKSEITEGEWDDDGPGWKAYPQITELLKPVAADDGIFWVSKAEFYKYFPTIYLCAKDMTEFLED